jgi:hypothetical protein
VAQCSVLQYWPFLTAAEVAVRLLVVGVYADAVNGKHERLGSTPRAHRKAPEIKAVWARSGAWPPRAQTERARSLSPVVVDHDAGTLGQPKTQL